MICFGGKFYQFKALSFGIYPAPWLCANLVSEMKAVVHGRGIQLHQFLDEWFGIATTPEECHQQAREVVQLIHLLIRVVNVKKSDLVPRQ